MNTLLGNRCSVDGLGQSILYTSLQLKQIVAYAGPASSHQHCGRDIHKSQDDHQDNHETGKLLSLTAIPGPVNPQVKVGGEHQAPPQRGSNQDRHMMSFKPERCGAPRHLEGCELRGLRVRSGAVSGAMWHGPQLGIPSRPRCSTDAKHWPRLTGTLPKTNDTWRSRLPGFTGLPRLICLACNPVPKSLFENVAVGRIGVVSGPHDPDVDQRASRAPEGL